MTNREHKKLLRAIRHQQEKRDNQQLAKKIDRAFSRLSEDCSNRVLKATSLVAFRDKKPEVTERKRNPANRRPVNHPTHLMNAHQRIRGKSTPLI